MLEYGSSPRTRGTARSSAPGLTVYRFIPANAGNSLARLGGFRRLSVHPRERGEQVVIALGVDRVHGSSPRTRGTDRRVLVLHPRGRFIPANAGNRFPALDPPVTGTVHPRERGEQTRNRQLWHPTAGSSPRTRGTDRAQRCDSPSYRFIPANAGNSGWQAARAQPEPVHPRERGEQNDAQVVVSAGTGSSPRTRGTAGLLAGRPRPGRFIPANAGNRRKG